MSQVILVHYKKFVKMCYNFQIVHYFPIRGYKLIICLVKLLITCRTQRVWLLRTNAGISTLSIDTCGRWMTCVCPSLTLIHIQTRVHLCHWVVISMISLSTGAVEPTNSVDTDTVTSTLVNILSKLTFIDILLTIGSMVARHAGARVWRYTCATIITWRLTESWNIDLSN